ncbi:MAG: methylenetetrahydrofolate reductase, partial [Microthrixaceae bacterium]|nr:methylenetetrahydrofolate reductase [Microthrixaceae bacterium]
SVTYGAGGSTRDRTRDLVVEINSAANWPAMAHLTCIGHTKAELIALLDDYHGTGVHNILALAGDPPADGSPAEGDFTYAHELVDLIRSRRGSDSSVGVAAHPELHPRSTERAKDRQHLAEKLAKADFAITQFFFDPAQYFDMVQEVQAATPGQRANPILPGIMPLTNPEGVRRMSTMSGTTFPEDLAERIQGTEDDTARQDLVVEHAVGLSQALLVGGAPGLHLYGLNRSETVLAIIEGLATEGILG